MRPTPKATRASPRTWRATPPRRRWPRRARAPNTARRTRRRASRSASCRRKSRTRPAPRGCRRRPIEHLAPVLAKIMRLRATARGSIAAVLLPLVIATAAPVAAEPAAGSSVGASSSPGGEISTPAPHAPAPGLESARHQALHRQGRPNAEDRLQRLVKGLKLDAAQQAEVRRALRSEEHTSELQSLTNLVC